MVISTRQSIGDIDRMRKKPERFDPGSEWVRYDPEQGLWILSRKRVFLYWYRFLQETEGLMITKLVEQNIKVGLVLNTKFDNWSEERWITLFEYEGT